MALSGYMSVEGEKQGKIDGGCTQKGRENLILVQEFNHEVSIPRDLQTGLATGKRIHHPFTIVKEMDKATPLLYQACCSGEHMKKVELKFYRISAKGTEEHYFTTTLTDAIIVSMKPYKPNCLDAATAKWPDLEEVAFTYRAISWRHETDKKESQDDWSVPVE